MWKLKWWLWLLTKRIIDKVQVELNGNNGILWKIKLFSFSDTTGKLWKGSNVGLSVSSSCFYYVFSDFHKEYNGCKYENVIKGLQWIDGNVKSFTEMKYTLNKRTFFT